MKWQATIAAVISIITLMTGTCDAMLGTIASQTAISFVDGNELIDVNYKALVEGEQRLQVIVVNKGSEPVTVTGQILLPGLKKVEAGLLPVFTDEEVLTLKQDNTVGLTIAPSRANILEFIPHSGITPADDIYTGHIIVFDAIGGIAITKSVQLEVKLQQPPPVEPGKAKFEIISPKILRYNYEKLASARDKKYITVALRNMENTTLQLSGSVEMRDVVDMDGRAVDLIFRMVERDKAGKYNEATKTTIDAGKINVVSFEILTLAIMPKPGRYEGVVKLSTFDTTKTIPIKLTVPGAKFEIIGAEERSYNFVDLTSSDDHRFIAIALRNNGESNLFVQASLNAQKNILSINGRPINLRFRQIVPDKEGGIQITDESIKIEVGNTTTLYFELEDRSLQPVPNTYRAFLTVKTTDETQKEEVRLNIGVPSVDGIAAKTYGEAVAGWFQQWPSRLTQRLFGRKLKLDPFLWIVGLVLLGWMIRLCVLYRRRHQLGTIEIQTLTDATGKDLQDEGLQALLKDTLENLGLDPPKPQPAASISTDIGDLITETGIPASGVLKGIKAIWQFVWRMICPIKGHQVATTLRATSEDIVAIVEVKDAPTGRIEAIESVSADTAEAAIRKVAHCIYLHAMKQKGILRRTPSWARFATAEGFELYQQGKQLEDEAAATDPYRPAECLTEVIERHQQAANLELNNALLRLALGSALVRSGRYIDGMEVYIHVITRWPELLEPRYRLAATLCFQDQLWSEWQKLKPKRKVELTSSLQDYVKQDGSTQSKKSVLPRQPLSKQYFLRLAQYQWEYLRQQLSWQVRFCRWMATFKPSIWRPDMRTYLWVFAQLWPWGWKRRQYQRAVEVAQYCTEIQRTPKLLEYVLIEVGKMMTPVKSVKSMLRRTRWWGMTWQVHYNAACAYAIALEILPNSSSAAEWAKKGLEQLSHVLRDPASVSSRSWLFDHKGDPDLEALRNLSEFELWKRRIQVDIPEAIQPGPKPQPNNDIVQGWELLAAGARLRRQRWVGRQQTILMWTSLEALHFHEIRKWYQREADLWTAVVELAAKNGDAVNQTAFWGELMQEMGQTAQKQLPTLSIKAASDKVRTYQKRWHRLEKCARSLQVNWDKAEDSLREAIHKPQQAPTIAKIGDDIEAAIEAWHSLESWADDPLEKARQDAFLAASSC